MENKRPAQSIWLKVGLLLTLALVAVPVLVAAQVAVVVVVALFNIVVPVVQQVILAVVRVLCLEIKYHHRVVVVDGVQQVAHLDSITVAISKLSQALPEAKQLH
jgi:hypothetical protein